MEQQLRTEHIGVMVTPEMQDKLEDAKSLRRGREASKSAIVSDILDYFFALSEEQKHQVLCVRTDGRGQS
jgi:hypothetical protein